MKVHTHSLHRATLTNNCPKCYSSSGLQIEVTQEERENAFYSKASKVLSALISCETCKSDVFPVEWDADLERVVDYHKKKADAKSSSIKLKPLAYLIILADAIIVAFIIWIVKN